MRILANELAFPLLTEGECHASHLTVTPEGEVLIAYFRGSREGHNDVCIYGSRRAADGSWGEPFPLSFGDSEPHWNPVFFERRDGAIILYYKAGAPIAEWRTYYRVSYDGGRSFSLPRELVPGDSSGGRGPVRNKPIYLRDGSILAPASVERGEWWCFFDRSTDEGKTFTKSRELHLPKKILATIPSPIINRGLIQPTVFESKNGVHALLRSSEGYIFRVDSADGIAWGDPYPTRMPNNNSGIDVVTLPDGRLLLACNPVSGNWGARTPMSLYVSEDNGEHFSLYTHLVTMPGRYDYPAMKYVDGKLHITYTFNRKTIQYFCLDEL